MKERFSLAPGPILLFGQEVMLFGLEGSLSCNLCHQDGRGNKIALEFGAVPAAL